MIKKDELEKIAQIKRISLENAEKDYLLELLLFFIYSEFGNSLILKGGTALYKLYNLNRFSEDLDFTLNKRRFDFEKFLSKILRSLRLIGIDGVADIEKYRNEINIRLKLKGPLYNGRKESLCFTSLNISLRENVKKIKKEMIIPKYKEIPSFDVFVMQEREILAEKVRAILTRNKPRDVYDLWFLIKRTEPEITLINQKLRKEKFYFKRFAEAIKEKQPLWETDLRGLIIGELPEFEKIKNEILNKFRKGL